MKAKKVLKMLKSKIELAAQNNSNYAIENSDIEAINRALNLHNVMKLVCENCHKKTASRYDRITGLYLCKDCYSKQTVL